ncbi:MAG: LanC-like protein [Rubrivivax sp.]|nr:LanC-like protein [Rubrivivax sp.]
MALWDPARHETLQGGAWDEARARACIQHIVAEAEARFSPETWWPQHPLDADPGDDQNTPATPLYYGACGVVWGLHYLQDQGAVQLQRNYLGLADALLARNRAWLADSADKEAASYMMGETPIRLLQFGATGDAAIAERLAELIAGNVEHPARELMWGSPGTLLAALFLHEHTGQSGWAQLFRTTAARLWAQLLWSEEHGCHYWTQDLYGKQSTYIDAVHGFVGTAAPLIRGRGLLGEAAWAGWQACIEQTVARTASREGPLANWRAWLVAPPGKGLLMQYCHGAPGFVINLAGMPGPGLDELLLAGGEATWAAGPLVKGSNLCHGTGGNGYAFLKLYRRSGDPRWLDRARAFAMHGIVQTEAHERQYGRLRYSLWTGDPGFAIYLWDCLRGAADFPTLDVY